MTSFRSFAKKYSKKLPKQGVEKKNKYSSNRIDHAGYSFGSKLEASVYEVLRLLKMSGEIIEIQVQDSVYLTDADILYKPDFKVIAANGEVYWVEAKGMATPVFNIKKRLWKYYGPGRLQIWGGKWKKPFLMDDIYKRERKTELPK